LVAVLGTPAASRADTITQTKSVGPLSVDFTAPLTFQKFNPALGPLNSITIIDKDTINAELMATNTGATPDLVTIKVDVTFTLKRPDNSTILSQTLTVSHSQLLAPAGMAGDSFDVMVMDMKTAMATVPPPFSDLALFTGAGNITLTLEATGNVTVTDTTGNADTFTATDGSATKTLIYNFGLQIPEPTSLALFAIGGVGIYLARRLRARRAPAV